MALLIFVRAFFFPVPALLDFLSDRKSRPAPTPLRCASPKKDILSCTPTLLLFGNTRGGQCGMNRGLPTLGFHPMESTFSEADSPYFYVFFFLLKN